MVKLQISNSLIDIAKEKLSIIIEESNEKNSVISTDSAFEKVITFVNNQSADIEKTIDINISNPDIDQLENKFKQANIIGKNKYLKTNEKINHNLDNFELIDALNLAYADMSRRATGHRDEIKDAFFKEKYSKIEDEKELSYSITDRFFKMLQDLVYDSDCNNFNLHHQKMCEFITTNSGKIIDNRLKHKKSADSTSFKFTYGRAQKFVNMALKYIKYVKIIENSRGEQLELKATFFCNPNMHMTLDRYTLDWYKNNVFDYKDSEHTTEIKTKGKLDSWNKIDDFDVYSEIQSNIKKYLADEKKLYFISTPKKKNIENTIIPTENYSQIYKLPKNPFQAEFIVWEGEKISESYGDLIKAFYNYFVNEDGEEKEAGIANDSWILKQETVVNYFCKKIKMFNKPIIKQD